MNPPLLLRPSAAPAIAAFALLLGLAACQSGRGPLRGPPVPEAGTEPQPPTPNMEAHATFFSGQVEAEVLLGRGGFPARNGARADAPGGGGDTGRSGFTGGFGGCGRRGGGGRGGGGGARGGGGESAESRGGSRESDDGTPVIHIVASNQPPVRLQLRLTNHGSNPIEVEVPDFNSVLGNFVVQPEKILLLPDQPVEANPMISRLGVGSDQIALTVALRADRKLEQQVLVLRVVQPAQPPPASAAGATPPPAKP